MSEEFTLVDIAIGSCFVVLSVAVFVQLVMHSCCLHRDGEPYGRYVLVASLCAGLLYAGLIFMGQETW